MDIDKISNELKMHKELLEKQKVTCKYEAIDFAVFSKLYYDEDLLPRQYMCFKHPSRGIITIEDVYEDFLIEKERQRNDTTDTNKQEL